MGIKMNFGFLFILFYLHTVAKGNLPKDHNPDDNCGMIRSNSSSEKNDLFNFQIWGYDYDNLPVMYFQLGTWNMRWLSEQPENTKLFLRNHELFIQTILNGELMKRVSNDSSPLVLVIVDLDGLDARQMISVPATKLMLNVHLKSLKLTEAMSYGFYINANPLAEQLLQMGKPFMGNLFELFELHGTNSKKWIPQLLKKISRNQLPQKFGGLENFEPILTCYLL